jgi:uncharacterized protein (DUF488 family)
VELLTIGYGSWAPAERWPRLLESLREARVEVLVDVRHSPCSSQLDPSHRYGPRDWHVQPEGAGIAAGLQAAGIEYRWLVELGNPQKTDPEMRVLREHLRDPSGGWPVQRGLAELRGLVLEARRRCCLLCACGDVERCHRKLVAEAFLEAASPRAVALRHLAGGARG